MFWIVLDNLNYNSVWNSSPFPLIRYLTGNHRTSQKIGPKSTSVISYWSSKKKLHPKFSFPHQTSLFLVAFIWFTEGPIASPKMFLNISLNLNIIIKNLHYPSSTRKKTSQIPLWYVTITHTPRPLTPAAPRTHTRRVHNGMGRIHSLINIFGYEEKMFKGG